MQMTEGWTAAQQGLRNTRDKHKSTHRHTIYTQAEIG